MSKYDNMITSIREYTENNNAITDGLNEEITHLKNLIVTMAHDINYEDGSIMDTSIQKVTNKPPHFVYHHYYNGTNKTGAKAYKWFLQTGDYLDIEQEELLPFTIDIYFSDSETKRISFKDTMNYFISEAKKGATILVSGRWYKDNRKDILNILVEFESIAELILDKFIIQSSIREWAETAELDGFRAMHKNDFMDDSKNMNKLIESV